MLRPILGVIVRFAVALTLAYPGPAQAQTETQTEEENIYTRCASLLEQAAGHLAAEQYPTMLKVAEERQRICPGPVSSFLVGLAQANMVANLLVTDPAARERMRLSALRSLKVAAAGGDALKVVWRFTVHDWIVHLQRLGPPVAGHGSAAEVQDEPPVEGPSEEPSVGAVPLQAPPPPPRPRFPWGPVITGSLGVAALVGALITGLTALNYDDRVADAERYVEEHTRQEGDPPLSMQEIETLQGYIDEANDYNARAATLTNWTTGLLIGGGVAVTSSITWYLFFPPRGGFRWAVTPSSMTLTARF